MTTSQPSVFRDAAKAEAEERARQTAVGWIIIFIALAPAEAFLLMLGLGAVHGIFAPVVAVGYGTAILLVLTADLVAFMANRFRRSK